MKRYIREAKKLDTDRVNKLKQTTPDTDASFITPDGYYINLTRNSYNSHLHFYVDMFDLYDTVSLGNNDEDRDEGYDSYFVDNYGWVRLRADKYYILMELPKSLTSNQWDALEKWLNFIEIRYPKTPMSIYVHNANFSYIDISDFGINLFSEDIIKLCKRCYSIGKFY